MIKGNGKDSDPDWLRAKKKRERQKAHKKSVRMDIRTDIIDSCGSIEEASRILSAAINGEDQLCVETKSAPIGEGSESREAAKLPPRKWYRHDDGSWTVEVPDPDAPDGKRIYEFTSKQFEEFVFNLSVTGCAAFPYQKKSIGNFHY